MGKKRKYKYFACDFETTVYEGQRNTEVWASAAVELGTEDVHIEVDYGKPTRYYDKNWNEVFPKECD